MADLPFQSSSLNTVKHSTDDTEQSQDVAAVCSPFIIPLHINTTAMALSHCLSGGLFFLFITTLS